MLKNKLYQHFGFKDFRKGQSEVITNIIDGKTAAAIFPTGAGKSLCYQLPAMLLPNLTLVISPLLSLMKDQLDFLLANNIPAARLDSTLSREEYRDVLNKAETGHLKILMISVERFRNERFREQLRNMKISLMVVDEAHCISEWGHNFRPDYLKLPTYRKEFNIEQVLLLTATATEKVIIDMAKKFDMPRKNVTVTGFYRENLYLKVTPVAETNKIAKLISILSDNPKAPTIIYVTLQKTAEKVAAHLEENKISAVPYHAGMKHEQREEIQNNFMSGAINCVVATIAFGMGVDKKDIRRVIHYDLPKSLENYSQEIGRSGRDGKKSVCEILASKDRLNVLENFIYGDTPERVGIYKVLEHIKNNPSSHWEIKLNTLSNETNIRILPLKTLLVYLEMKKIIKSQFTYFADYSLKMAEPPHTIISRFNGERKEFIKSIFDNSISSRVWTTVDVDSVVQLYPTERKRVLSALEYFNEKGWAELQAKQAVDVYQILDNKFNIEQMADELFTTFQLKENNEIARIQTMLDFFESDSCLSIKLADYFDDKIEKEKCGHCSFCDNGKAKIIDSTQNKNLKNLSFREITKDYFQTGQKSVSVANLTKFLCGINIPLFTKLKAKRIPNYALLENYPYKEVNNWVKENIDRDRD